MTLNRYILQDIKSKLDKIEHCGDYGRFWLHRVEPKIFLELGDADEVEFEYPGFGAIIGTECGPEDEENWLLLSYGTEVYYNVLKFGVDTPYEETVEKHVRLLSLPEYNSYYHYFKQLKD